MTQGSACNSVVVGSFHQLMAEGLVGVLVEAGCKDVRGAYSADEVLAAVGERRPDVVIVDGCMCSDEMVLVRTLVARGQPVVLVTGHDWSGLLLLQALEAGARGCLSYDEDPVTFTKALELISRGIVLASQDLAGKMVAMALNRRAEVDPGRLSSREAQIASMVAQGATNREIADALSISEHTVKIHLGHILEKLDLRNRQQVAAYMSERAGKSVEAQPQV